MFKHVTSLGKTYYRVLDIKQIKQKVYELTLAIDHLDKQCLADYHNEKEKHTIKQVNPTK
jgi:hypothetical protein